MPLFFQILCTLWHFCDIIVDTLTGRRFQQKTSMKLERLVKIIVMDQMLMNEWKKIT